jgi:hypothetical protein
VNLPDQQPTAPQAGQPTINDNARRFLADLESAYDAQRAQIPTSYRDTSPIPAYGPTPPADQPGARRPPMSQRAVDLNTTILSSSVLTATLGGTATAIMWASGHANPTVIAWICAGAVAIPAALTIPVLALKGLMKSAKEVVQAAPPTIHQHYSGPITQTTTTINADSHGLVAVTRPQLPPAPSN